MAHDSCTGVMRMAMSGLRDKLNGNGFKVDHLAVLFWVMSQLIIGYLYTWATVFSTEFIRMLMFIQFMGITGMIAIMMLKVAQVAWVGREDLDGIAQGVMVGMIGILVIQVATAFMAPYQSEFVDTMVLMPIIMLPVAVSEEFLYRGFLYAFMYKMMPPTMGGNMKFAIAGAMSSIMFAAGHAFVYGAYNFVAIFSAFAAGMMFAFSYTKSKMLTVPILVHFMNNAIMALMLVM